MMLSQLQPHLTIHNPSTDCENHKPVGDDAYWKWKIGKQMRGMGLMLRAVHAENTQLCEAIRGIMNDATEGQFQTPDEEQRGERRLQPGEPEGTERPQNNHQGLPQEHDRQEGPSVLAGSAASFGALVHNGPSHALHVLDAAVNAGDAEAD